jgi:CDP-diglyceride synthetase
MKKTLLFLIMGIVLVLIGVFVYIESKDNSIRYAFILSGVVFELFAVVQIAKNSMIKK